MYNSNGARWLKHLDFIALDVLCMALAWMFAFLTRFHSFNTMDRAHVSLLISLLVLDFVVCTVGQMFKNVLKRGYMIEFGYTLRNAAFIFALDALLLFSLQAGADVSRLVFFFTAVYYVLLGYVTRCVYKNLYRRYVIPSRGRSLLFITDSAAWPELQRHISSRYFAAFRLAGIAFMDEAPSGCTLPVVADKDSVEDYVRQNWVDEIMLLLPPDDTAFRFAEIFMSMGIAVHLGLEHSIDRMPEGQRQVEKIGGFSCVTVSWNSVSQPAAMFKRVLDIVGGLVGCLITLILTFFIGPAIRIASPGPIFFQQERVGRNGKTFKMLKFRSMVMNADELKAQYMAQNRVSDGMMFKLDWDPRIIGNRTLPDGTRKTGIGDFIRRTSLDEFPQFFNVLKGDMSLVGTRPPTLDEWEKYEDHHRARLAMKPGITGLWQVSGRSKITDFEEVVKLDTQYIAEWTPWLDLKILFRTVAVVLKHDGSM